MLNLERIAELQKKIAELNNSTHNRTHASLSTNEKVRLHREWRELLIDYCRAADIKPPEDASNATMARILEESGYVV